MGVSSHFIFTYKEVNDKQINRHLLEMMKIDGSFYALNSVV